MVLVTEGMQKIRIIALREDVERVVNELVDFGAIHVTRAKHGEAGEPLEKFDEIAGELVWLRACEKILGLEKAKRVSFAGLRPLDELLSEAKGFRKKADELVSWNEELQAARAKENSLASRARELEPFKDLAIPTSLLESTALEFKYLQLKTRREELLNAAKQLKALRASFLFVPGARTTWVLAAFDRKQAEKASALLAAHCGPAIDFPKTTAKTFPEEWKNVERELAEARKRIAELVDRMNSFKKKHLGTVIALRQGLEVHARKAELPARFGKTRSLEIIEGWVPARFAAGLEKRLGKKFAEKILVDKVRTEEAPPTKLSNPRVVRGFEFLVKFFSLPGRGEWDPTLFIAITFPVIFGMILGDMGYGVVSFAVALLVKAKIKGEFFQSAAGMLLLSSITTIAFGFVYGEVFGAEEFTGITLHPFIERGGEEVNVLVAAALLVGVVHVALGLAISVAWNAWAGHYRHAVAKMFWLALESAFIIIAAALVLPQLVAGIPSPLLLGGGMAMASLAGLYFFEGYPAVFEVPSLLANILSYLRIMALGLSGVILAKIINQIPVGPAREGMVASVGRADAAGLVASFLSFAAFAFVLVAGHAGALALGLFESSIQSLRLHYVEFFSKFYRGGGFPFVPLNKEIRGE